MSVWVNATAKEVEAQHGSPLSRVPTADGKVRCEYAGGLFVVFSKGRAQHWGPVILGEVSGPAPARPRSRVLAVLAVAIATLVALVISLAIFGDPPSAEPRPTRPKIPAPTR